MDKHEIRAVIARNIQLLMAQTPGLETQPALAERAGVAQSQVSRILRREIGCGVDVLAAIAKAFGRQPFELLIDAEETRRSILAQIIGAQPVPDAEVERHLPRPPGKVVAMKRRRN